MFDVFDKPTWNDRESLFIYKPEVSGIMDGTSTIYQYAYPDTNYPILRMPFDIYDKEGNILPHGMYMIALDYDRKYLMFLQSNEIKARVPVAGLTEQMREDSDFKKREELAMKYQKYMNRGKQRKAKKFKKELEIIKSEKQYSYRNKSDRKRDFDRDREDRGFRTQKKIEEIREEPSSSRYKKSRYGNTSFNTEESNPKKYNRFARNDEEDQKEVVIKEERRVRPKRYGYSKEEKPQIID